MIIGIIIIIIIMMLSLSKAGMQAKGILKQYPETNICAQEWWEWAEKAPYKNLIVCNVHLTLSGWLNIEY